MDSVAKTQPVKYILRRQDDGTYFPLTQCRDIRSGQEYVTRYSDGIWWALQGIPPNVIFEPEPEGDEIIIDLGFGKVKAVRRK
ncbi:unnamed protein product [marine sediment metagenome]|uniref:Uncharacterized protein n=1 Tax=marine sediment metagenome TaxID=412755 RepID=X1W187_9ZZZZ